MPKRKTTPTIWVSGRRKTAVARIKINAGKGAFTVNDQIQATDYFPSDLEQRKLTQPFQVAGRDIKGYDISIKFSGGGKKSQLNAAILGLAKSLIETDENLKPLLKKYGLLTRDPRMKERKKYGLKRARKAPQYSKR